MNNFKNSNFTKNKKYGPTYYINRFFSLKCSADLLANQLFPNAKEITESFAAFEATKYLDDEFDWKNPDVNVVCVGDGVKPRTAATFALRTKWNCHSVDPILRNRSYNIKRLNLYPSKIEDITLQFDTPTLICCVHSHAKLSHCIQSIKAPKVNIINLPCCFQSDLPFLPCIEYKDDQIWSEKNLMQIWK